MVERIFILAPLGTLQRQRALSWGLLSLCCCMCQQGLAKAEGIRACRGRMKEAEGQSFTEWERILCRPWEIVFHRNHGNMFKMDSCYCLCREDGPLRPWTPQSVTSVLNQDHERFWCWCLFHAISEWTQVWNQQFPLTSSFVVYLPLSSVPPTSR